MKVLVLGGSGLFGRKTSAALLKDPDIAIVVSMDLMPPPEWFIKTVDEYSDKFHYVRGDVSQIEDILSVMKLHSIDRVINWA
ncbi:unnamed protein product, partial [marine sediment metagenome]